MKITNKIQTTMTVYIVLTDAMFGGMDGIMRCYSDRIKAESYRDDMEKKYDGLDVIVRRLNDCDTNIVYATISNDEYGGLDTIGCYDCYDEASIHSNKISALECIEVKTVMFIVID